MHSLVAFGVKIIRVILSRPVSFERDEVMTVREIPSLLTPISLSISGIGGALPAPQDCRGILSAMGM